MSYKFNPFTGNFDIVGSASGGTGDPGGSTTQVQFNDGGAFGGDSTFTFNKTTDTLSLSNLTASGTTTLSGGTANGVAYLNGSQALTTGTGLVFDGTNLGIGTSSPGAKLTVEVPGSAVQMRLIASSTAILRSRYVDATAGFSFESSNSAEDAYIPFSLTGSTVRFNTGTGANAATIDSSGNLGLGVTPSAWNGGSKAIQLGAQGVVEYRGSGTSLGTNAFFDSVGWKYITSNPAALYNQYQNSHAWYTAPSGTAGAAISFTQAMTLNASGNLLVAYTGGAYDDPGANGVTGISIRGQSGSTGIIVSSQNSQTSYNYYSYRLGASTTGYHMVFSHDSVTVGSITTSSTETTYGQSSDYRLKENIQPIQNALSRVALLKPSKYIWKSDQSEGEGFIAHELQEVVPQAVTGEKDGERMQGVDYGKLTPLLAAAIQEITARLETLEQRIN